MFETEDEAQHIHDASVAGIFKMRCEKFMMPMEPEYSGSGAKYSRCKRGRNTQDEVHDMGAT